MKMKKLLAVSAIFGFCVTGLYSVAFSQSEEASKSAHPPAIGNVTPSSGGSLAGEEVLFTTEYKDENGWENIWYTRLLINNRINGRECAYVNYERGQNKLYIRKDDHTGWLGGFAPGSAHVIENSYAKLDCSRLLFQGREIH